MVDNAITIRDITKEAFLKHTSDGALYLQFEEDYYNVEFCYCVNIDTRQIYISIKKNNDGLQPIIKIFEKMLIIAYGFCVDFYSVESLHQYRHYSLDSLVFDLLRVADKTLVILETGVIQFSKDFAYICNAYWYDIITSYELVGNQLKLSTIDGCNHILDM